ncbi:hypothetical protein SAMN04487895_104224 [Paenibacillus sophorae]|uniref:Uncharacterized protein n=1 Tax=Paenibacillus sophorae TaxID=1333845 RepID=A0A1H8L820_9BACL|nr:hypothetical protein [Paenibacillus sophorae]QWU17390.1 hypothetical protein KP014_09675 [Paenibacillus sophorae]SEO01330.1 hypothetical protein SAMN04487895_104224 [Paenibacillus sophorae]
MPTTEEVAAWIVGNVLDTEAWDKKPEKQPLAVKQAERNLSRWYPEVELMVEVVSLQAIWELQGLDPALKFQRHAVKSLNDNGEGITYSGIRDVVAPEVRELLGKPAFELAEEAEDAPGPQYGGCLI